MARAKTARANTNDLKETEVIKIGWETIGKIGRFSSKHETWFIATPTMYKGKTHFAWTDYKAKGKEQACQALMNRYTAKIANEAATAARRQALAEMRDEVKAAKDRLVELEAQTLETASESLTDAELIETLAKRYRKHTRRDQLEMVKDFEETADGMVREIAKRADKDMISENEAYLSKCRYAEELEDAATTAGAVLAEAARLAFATSDNERADAIRDLKHHLAMDHGVLDKSAVQWLI